MLTIKTNLKPPSRNFNKTKINTQNTNIRIKNNAVPLNNSAYNNYGKYIAFGARLKYTNIIAHNFSQTGFFPAHRKVPDGLKFFSRFYNNQKMSSPINSRGCINTIKPEQITIVDRKKDKDLIFLINAYKNFMKEIKSDFGSTVRKSTEWRDILKENTELFINTLPTTDFVKKTDLLTNKDIEDKEVYLGEIFKNNLAVCRHRAFLNKLLLETQGIDVGIQDGYVIKDNNSVKDWFFGHSWNTDKKQIYDISWNADKSNYMNMYFQKLHANKYLEQFKKLNPGDTMTIGVTADNKLITNQSKERFKPILKLHWNENDEFILSKINSESTVKVDKELLCDQVILDRKIVVNTDQSNAIEIDPREIRIDFKRRYTNAHLKMKYENYSFYDLAKESEDINEDNLIIYNSPNFRQNWAQR